MKRIMRIAITSMSSMRVNACDERKKEYMNMVKTYFERENRFFVSYFSLP
jgi:hypothetical protein